VDTYILKFFLTAIYMGGTSLIETRGDFNATKELFKKSYWL